jgi:chemotaxis protein CheD
LYRLSNSAATTPVAQQSINGESATAPCSGDRSKFYLHPGQLFVASESYAVTTILGSCVSVCLWDPLTEIGGINHFLLPMDVGDDQASLRFGNHAVRELIEEILGLGAEQMRLRAKLFGGACVLEAFRSRENHLGTKNVQIAREVLQAADIPIVGHDVGGDRGRKLIFHTDNGSAWIKQL